MVNNWLNSIQQYCFPAHCLLCGSRCGHPLPLCTACRDDLPALYMAYRQCAQPLATAGICGQCQQAPPPQQDTLALWHYRPPVDYLIQQMKFHQRLDLTRVLGKLLAGYIQSTGCTMPELIIPVPLHPSRLRERGFNQALEIARPLARHLDIPLDIRATRRCVPTRSQSLLPADQRVHNMRHAFGVTRPIAASHIAIVDDVMTTGATVAELARELRLAGAGRISVWVVARASGQH